MRTFVQSKLNELTDVDSGVIQMDDVIEIGTTYFGYELQDNYLSSDFSRNDIKRISIIGYLIRKNKNDEDTLSILDEASIDVENKLKEINFKISKEDITIQEEIRKIKITGYVNIKNDELVF